MKSLTLIWSVLHKTMRPAHPSNFSGPSHQDNLTLYSPGSAMQDINSPIEGRKKFFRETRQKTGFSQDSPASWQLQPLAHCSGFARLGVGPFDGRSFLRSIQTSMGTVINCP
jgi:hypothetical protein